MPIGADPIDAAPINADPFERVVLDASAVLHLLLGQVPGDSARLTDHSELHSAAILPAEVHNVLRRHRAAQLISSHEADTAVAMFEELPFVLWPFATVSRRAWELSHGVSSYDAWYAALAEHLDAPLVTSDQRLIRALDATSITALPTEALFR